ncbi:MAG TPA: PPC domain-containing DNA-binding protein [Gemmatimonadaceae bacterium]|nr:PPC domain-containing DNA-binding protein [Gemmatimonadaceae bacterium]
MKSRVLHASEHARRFAVVLDPGDEAIWCLRAFADAEQLTGYFTAIGAFREATVAYWEPELRSYRDIPIHDQVEVLALTGNISLLDDGTRKVHSHAVLGASDGRALGGHLRKGFVRPTLEVLVEESPVRLRRVRDESTGLDLLEL